MHTHSNAHRSHRRGVTRTHTHISTQGASFKGTRSKTFLSCLFPGNNKEKRTKVDLKQFLVIGIAARKEEPPDAHHKRGIWRTDVAGHNNKRLLEYPDEKLPGGAMFHKRLPKLYYTSGTEDKDLHAVAIRYPSSGATFHDPGLKSAHPLTLHLLDSRLCRITAIYEISEDCFPRL